MLDKKLQDATEAYGFGEDIKAGNADMKAAVALYLKSMQNCSETNHYFEKIQDLGKDFLA